MVTPSEAVIRVRHFSKRYRRQKAVEDVSLQVWGGELYGLIGPDGSGKSTLLKAVAGVLSFDGGEVEVFGVRLDSERAAERVKGRIGFMPQGLGQHLYPDLSVEENIDFFARLRLVPEAALAERKERLLRVTRLAAYRARAVKHLSGGMKQKLGLVCTLIHEPEILVLDEPTTGVDPVSRRDFWAILTDLMRERRVTALISTAYMDEATRFHRMALLFSGSILAQGEPEQVQALAPGGLVTLRAEPQVEALAALQRRFAQVQAYGSWLRVFVQGVDGETAARQVTSALAGLRLDRLEVGEPDLEDVFVALLRQHQLVDTKGEKPPAIRAARSHGGGAADDGVAIQAEGLIRDFDGFRAVDGVSFCLRQGEIFGLLGANGAGKTTVIKMLTGILPPTAGEGRVAGADMRRAGQEVKERVGYMSQAFSLYLDLTVLENVRLFAGIYGLSRREAREPIEWVVRMAGLAGYESWLTSRVPLGVRQRLALGCALVHRPRVLFLDEPTSGVDPVGRRRFWDILLRLSREEGVAILVTTHYMSEAEHCDRLALMHAGKIVAAATAEEMKRQLEAEAGTLLELTAEPVLLALQLLEAAGFAGVALFGKRLHLLSPEPEAERGRIARILAEGGAALRTLEPKSPSLEDVFVYRILARERLNRSAGKGEGARP